MENFVEKFKEALEIEMTDVKYEDEFRSFAEWDSLSRLSLIAMMDEEYGVQIEDHDFESLKTVNDIMNAVKSRMK